MRAAKLSSLVLALAVGCGGSVDETQDVVTDSEVDSNVDTRTTEEDSTTPDTATPVDTAIPDTGAAVDSGGSKSDSRPADASGETVSDVKTDGGSTESAIDTAVADSAVADTFEPLPDGPLPVSPEPIPAAPVTAFPLGVASGDVESTRAILWTRYAGTSPLKLHVWQMIGDVYAYELPTMDVTPGDGGFAHREVIGLSPGKRYRYAFVEMDGAAQKARSPIGRFRAALAAGTQEKLVFGAISCVSNARDPKPLLQAGKRTDLDLWLFLGDTTYNDGAAGLDEFRAKWKSNFEKPAFLDVRRNNSLLATWDDHEVDNDWNPETVNATKLTAAKKTFFEHLPLRRSAESADRIWKSVKWGDTVEVFVLDTRGERKPSTRTTAAAQYISPEQLAWFKDALSKSTAKFKLIMNSVPITNMPSVWDAQPQDRWEGYAAQRTEVLKYIDDNIKGVLWVAGDFHLEFTARVSPSGVGSTQTEVLVGAGAQSANPLAWSLAAPQFDWKSSTTNYTTLTLDPAAGSIKVEYFDETNTMFHEGTFTP